MVMNIFITLSHGSLKKPYDIHIAVSYMYACLVLIQ